MPDEPRQFGAYRLENVHLKASAAQRAEAAAFWIEQRALRNPGEATRRSAELVYLVRRPDGALAGMSTVGLRVGPDGRLYYVYRMFLRREDRTPYLMRAVTNASRDFLHGFPHPHGPVAGMLIVAENRKLMRPGIRRYFGRHGYQYHGKTPRGLDLWLAPFDVPGASQPQEETTP